MKLGLVLGGIADGAMNTYKTLQEQARAQQVEADAHAQQLRLQAEQHSMDMTSAATDNQATATDTAATAAATAGAIPTPAAPAAPMVAAAPTATAPPLNALGVPAATTDASGAVVPTPFAPTVSATMPASQAPGGVVTDPNAPPPPAATTISPAVVQTLIQEAGRDPRGVAAVASVIRNRMVDGHETPDQVVSDPNQFGMGAPATSGEHAAWLRTASATAAQPGSPLYKAVEAMAAPILTGAAPPIGNYTGYYSPSASVALKESPPKWDDGTGHDIAGNRFFSHPYHGVAHPANQQSTAAPTVGLNQQVPQPAGADASTQQFYASSGPSVYDHPDGSGPMVTYSPRRQTTDTAADQLAMRQAAIWRASGLPEGEQNASQIEADVYNRHARAQSLNAADIEANRVQTVDALSRVTAVDQLPALYNQLSNRHHLNAVQNSDGSVHVQFYNNDDPTKLVGHDDFANLNDLKSKVATMISSPAAYQSTMDAHDKLVADVARQHADTAQSQATTANTQAQTDSGLFPAQAAAAQAAAAEAKSRADALNLDTQTKQQLKEANAALAAATDPAQRDTLTQRIAALNGSLQPVTSTIYSNGMQNTLNTYPQNGLRTTFNPQTGQEYELGQQAQVDGALANAKKQNVPLTYGRFNDSHGMPHMMYGIAGHPELGTSASADDMFTEYQNLAKKNKGALPTAAPTASTASAGAGGVDALGVPGH